MHSSTEARRERLWPLCRTTGDSMGNVYTAGYSEAGGSHKKRSMRDFDPVSASPAEDIDFNNLTLRQRSRMLYMSGSVGTSAINTVRTKVVGTGLTLKAEIGREFLGVNEESAKDWQRRVEAEFRLWADRRENCDGSGYPGGRGKSDIPVLARIVRVVEDFTGMTEWRVYGHIAPLSPRAAVRELKKSTGLYDQRIVSILEKVVLSSE